MANSADNLVVSYTQLNSFDRCEYAYHLRYEEGWQKKEKSVALSLGSEVHSLLEVYYRGRMSRRFNDPELRDMVQEAIQEHIQAAGMDVNALDTVRRAGTLVLRYIDDYVPFNDYEWTPLAVEQHFQIDLEDANGEPFEIQGYVDALMLHEKSGKIWAWDHKTVGGGKFYTPMEVTLDVQMPTYSLLLAELGYDIFGMLYNMLNTYDYKNTPDVDKLFRRERTYRTDIELGNIIKELQLAVADLRAMRRREFRRRSLKRDCTWCDFAEPCLMALKGVNPLPILESNYTRKSDESKKGNANSTHV